MKKTILSIAVLALFTAAGLLMPYLNKEKQVVEVHATYPAFTLEELSLTADQIVHGVVTKRGESKIVKIPLSTEIEIDKRSEGQFIEEVVTEVEIKVIDPLKNSNKHTTVKYIEEGGDLGEIVYTNEIGALKEGEEVVIFMNKAGFSWGPQSVYKVADDNKVKLEFYNDHKGYTLSEVKEKIRNAIENKS